MPPTNQQIFDFSSQDANRTTQLAPSQTVFAFRRATWMSPRLAWQLRLLDPEPSSDNVISPADAVRRYWRWDTMPETMKRLA